MRRVRGNLTYANVMATIAVFLVLGGSAVAATHLPGNSVGTKQLKKGAVTPGKLSAKTRGIFAGPAGPSGLAGPKGDPGANGAPGNEGSEGAVGATGGNAGGSTNLLRTTEFNEVMAAPYPADSELASLTFTPPESGKVLVQGRGHCEVPTTTTSFEEAVLVFAENSWEEGVSRLRELGPAEDGVAGVPAQSSTASSDYILAWSAQTILTVVGGEATTTRLFGDTFPGVGSVRARCFGTITVTGIF